MPAPMSNDHKMTVTGKADEFVAWHYGIPAELFQLIKRWCRPGITHADQKSYI